MTALVPLCLGWMSNDASLMVPGETGPMRYPIPGYAVVHERGTVLFDTGLHEPLMTSTDELGALAAMFEPELTPADFAEARLTEAGIDPESVTHVVNSHLHFDHCGRNGPVPPRRHADPDRRVGGGAAPDEVRLRRGAVRRDRRR